MRFDFPGTFYWQKVCFFLCNPEQAIFRPKKQINPLKNHSPQSKGIYNRQSKCIPQYAIRSVSIIVNEKIRTYPD
jgi:hypothetical protein